MYWGLLAYAENKMRKYLDKPKSFKRYSILFKAYSLTLVGLNDKAVSNISSLLLRFKK